MECENGQKVMKVCNGSCNFSNFALAFCQMYAVFVVIRKKKNYWFRKFVFSSFLCKLSRLKKCSGNVMEKKFTKSRKHESGVSKALLACLVQVDPQVRLLIWAFMFYLNHL